MPKQEKSKPKYEAPVVLPLGDLAKGIGATCKPGGSANSCSRGAYAANNCKTGDAALSRCANGGAASGNCRIGGSTTP
jgi:hypothetical protein